MFATVICNFFELLYARLVYCEPVAKKTRLWHVFSTPLDPQHFVLKIQRHPVVFQQISPQS
jgi:hypothetical protein